jgi:hypothetical protein
MRPYIMVAQMVLSAVPRCTDVAADRRHTARWAQRGASRAA